MGNCEGNLYDTIDVLGDISRSQEVWTFQLFFIIKATLEPYVSSVIVLADLWAPLQKVFYWRFLYSSKSLWWIFGGGTSLSVTSKYYVIMPTLILYADYFVYFLFYHTIMLLKFFFKYLFWHLLHSTVLSMSVFGFNCNVCLSKPIKWYIHNTNNLLPNNRIVLMYFDWFAIIFHISYVLTNVSLFYLSTLFTNLFLY